MSRASSPWPELSTDIGDGEGTCALGSLAMWPDGLHLMADAGRDVVVWDIRSGEVLCRQANGATCRDARPHFKLTIDERARRFATARGIRGFALWGLDRLELQQVFEGHAEEVYGAVLFDELVLSGSGDGSLRSWDAATGQCRKTLETRPIACLAASPSRHVVAAGGSCGPGRGQVLLVDPASLSVVRTIDLAVEEAVYPPLSAARRHSAGITWNDRRARVSCVAWHPGGQHLVTGGWDFAVRMFDAETGRRARMWTGHSHWVTSVACTTDGSRVVSGSSDGRVLVWSVDSGACLAEFEPGGAIRDVCLVEDRIFAASSDGTVYVLPLGAPEDAAGAERP